MCYDLETYRATLLDGLRKGLAAEVLEAIQGGEISAGPEHLAHLNTLPSAHKTSPSLVTVDLRDQFGGGVVIFLLRVELEADLGEFERRDGCHLGDNGDGTREGLNEGK